MAGEDDDNGGKRREEGWDMRRWVLREVPRDSDNSTLDAGESQTMTDQAIQIGETMRGNAISE
eukprot:8037667-Pyramimonas_sp.AAC.1